MRAMNRPDIGRSPVALRLLQVSGPPTVIFLNLNLPTMTQLQQLTTWLNDAYSMEESLAKVLESHAKDAADYPEMSRRIAEHLEETRAHAVRVAECLAILGQKPSTIKAAVGNMMGIMQGASTRMFRDELVKNVLADYAAEYFEIACYTSLIAGAESAGYSSIAEICRGILLDEEAMAAWLETQISVVTEAALRQATVA